MDTSALDDTFPGTNPNLHTSDVSQIEKVFQIVAAHTPTINLIFEVDKPRLW